MNKKTFLFAAIAAAAAPALAQNDPVLVKINGVPVTRSQVAQRAYNEYGNAAINEIMDDILIRQAADKLNVRPDQKEINDRIRRIANQFPDEKTFEQKLLANGSSLGALRAQISDELLREELVTKANDISVTNKEAREYYNLNKSNLGGAPAVHLRDIIVESAKEAADFATAARAGADFAQLASEVSTDKATKDKGGDLGFISRGMLQPAIEKQVFAAKAGSVLGPLPAPSGNGYIILKIDAFRQGKSVSYDSIRGQLKDAMLADKIKKAWPGYIQKLRQQAKVDTNNASAAPQAGQAGR